VSKKIKPKNQSCNMCHQNMPMTTPLFYGVRVCSNPFCPNYALLQISAEKMPHEELTLAKLKKIDKKLFKEKK
jgi:hypothetical protein